MLASVSGSGAGRPEKRDGDHYAKIRCQLVGQGYDRQP
jgi:hypothetical protein